VRESIGVEHRKQWVWIVDEAITLSGPWVGLIPEVTLYGGRQLRGQARSSQRSNGAARYELHVDDQRFLGLRFELALRRFTDLPGFGLPLLGHYLLTWRRFDKTGHLDADLAATTANQEIGTLMRLDVCCRESSHPKESIHGTSFSPFVHCSLRPG
jgi:hypothetical protein